MHILVETNNLPYLKKFLQICRSREFDVDCRNASGLTPLLIAIRLGSFRAAFELLRSGADPSVRDSELKLNALDWILREDLKEHSQIQLAPRGGRRFQLIWKKTIRLKSQYEKPLSPICKHRSRFDNEAIMDRDQQAAAVKPKSVDLDYRDKVIDMIDEFFGRYPTTSMGSKQRTMLSMISGCDGGTMPPSSSQYRTFSGWPKTAKMRALMQKREESLPLWTLLDLYTTKSSPAFRATVKPELIEFDVSHACFNDFNLFFFFKLFKSYKFACSSSCFAWPFDLSQLASENDGSSL